MEEILKWLFYGLVAILSWIGKTLWDAVQALKRDVHDLEVKLPENYVSKPELNMMMETVLRKLDKIETLFISHINDAFKDRTK